jgi:hypothetical protein
MTNSDRPAPNVRVTRRSSTPERPHAAQWTLRKVDRDDEEGASWADFDDCFSRSSVEG